MCVHVCVLLKKCTGDTSLASRSSKPPHRAAHQFCRGTGLTVTPGSPALCYKKPAYALLLGGEKKWKRVNELERYRRNWVRGRVCVDPSIPYGEAVPRTADGQAGRDGPSAPFAGVFNDYIISSIRSSLSFMGFLVSPALVWGEKRGKIYPATPPSVSCKTHMPSSRKQGLYSTFMRA